MNIYILNQITISQIFKKMMILLCFMVLLTSAKKVHCVFIHGAGTIPESGYKDGVYRDVRNLPKDVLEYWGPVTHWTEKTDTKRPICTSYAFTYLDTVHNSWKNENLTKNACRALEDEYKDDEDVITRVFLHSMGNLIFFNALKTGKCKINSKRTNVYSFGGPFLGSDMVKVAEAACQAKIVAQDMNIVARVLSAGVRFINLIKDFANKFFSKSDKNPEEESEISRICDIKTGKLTTAFKSLGNFAENVDNEILGLAKKYVKGGICGVEVGENNFFEKLLSKGILDKLHKTSEHDGVVHVNSCKAFNTDPKIWGFEFTNDFLLAKFHHNQIIGRTGEPEILKWLAQRK